MKICVLLICLLCFLIAPAGPLLQAQGERLPEAHLGYGIHLDPNVPVDPAMVDALGMDWVKLYADSQIPLFPDKRILFRQDMNYPADWEAFRAEISGRAQFLAAQGVEAIEIHNEPNLSLEWRGQRPNAREYTEMLRAAYQAIKAVAPGLIVVSGGLAPTITTADGLAVNDLDYAREMLQNGAAQWFDAFGYHPYGYNAPPEEAPAYNKLNFRRTELIWDLLQQYGVTDKQIWLTEFGWMRDPAEDGVNCADTDPDFAGFAWLRVSGETQADFITRAFAYADRFWPWAGPSFLWNLNFSQRPDDGSLPACSHMRWFGLLKRTGASTPAFDRVAAMPKRYSRYQPIMVLYADAMTLETGLDCQGWQGVGSFKIGNTGYPGSFSVSAAAALAPNGPPLRLDSNTARTGQNLRVSADTRGLNPGLYVIYINVRTSIGGQLRAQYVRGFVVIRESPSGVCTLENP